MKTLTKLALAITILTTAVAARADWVSGHFRGNGTYVAPYYRTPANGNPFDNLSYRGYPSQQPGYVSPRHYASDSSGTMPKYDFGQSSSRPLGDGFGTGLQTLPNWGRTYKPHTFGF